MGLIGKSIILKKDKKRTSSNELSNFNSVFSKDSISPIQRKKENNYNFNNPEKKLSFNERTQDKIQDKTNDKTHESPQHRRSIDKRLSHKNEKIDRKSIALLNDFLKQFQDVYLRVHNVADIPKEINALVELYRTKLTQLSLQSISLGAITQFNSQTITNYFESTKTLPMESILEEKFIKTSARMLKMNKNNESMENIMSNNISLDKIHREKEHIGAFKKYEDSHSNNHHLPHNLNKIKNFKLNLNINNDTSPSRISENSNSRREDSLSSEKRNRNKSPLQELEEKTNKLFSKYAHIKREIHKDFSMHNLNNFKDKFKKTKLHSVNSPLKLFKKNSQQI